MDIYYRISDILESRKEKLINGVKYKTITNLLNRSFNKQFSDFKFVYETYNHIQPDDISVAGVYDFNKDKKYVVFSFSEELDNIYIDEAQWDDLKFLIAQTCMHESVHQDQFKHRDKSLFGMEKLDFRKLSQDSEEDETYLADKDEIDAYAHDLALEIKHFYPFFSSSYVLNTVSKRRYCWSYRYYSKTYKGQDWSKVKKRLLKKTYIWLLKFNKGPTCLTG